MTVAAYLLDDVPTCRQPFGAVDQLDRRGGVGQLEGVEGGAVAAADHDHVTARRSGQVGTRPVGHVAAERAVGGGGQDLSGRAGGDEQARRGSGPAGLHPAGTEIRPGSRRGHRTRSPRMAVERCRAGLER